jgi:diguanylate cyclase (GGDEF)-like protein
MTQLVAVAHLVELALENVITTEELARTANLDPLTGCVNRRGLASVAPAMGTFVVIVADLDGLKTINDSFGHDKGDAALANFASVLLGAVRPTDVVARLGGDEFMVLLDGATAATGQAVAERILSNLIEQGEVPAVRASLGISCSEERLPLEVVVQQADQAMYEAKRSGGMRIHHWSSATVDSP